MSEVRGDTRDYSLNEIGGTREEDLPFEIEVENYVREIKALTVEPKTIVKDLLLRNRAVFSKKPGKTHVYEHNIHLLTDKPFVRKSYPVPLSMRPAVDKEIQ